MKKLSQSLCAMLAALSLCCGTTSVWAAQDSPPQQPLYSVNVENGAVQFLWDGAVTGTFAAKTPVDLIVFTDQTGNLVVQFPQPDGARKSITLADQKSLSLDGQIGRISLDQSLSREIAVALAPSASASQMFVQSSGNQVSIYGKPGTLNVGGAAQVTIGPEAVVSALHVTQAAASVKADPKARVAKAVAVNQAAISGVASVSKFSTVSSGLFSADVQTSSSRSDRSHPSSSSSNNTSNVSKPNTPVTPSDPYAGLSITAVYPTTQNVRVELNKAVALDASAFYISCPVGKDMTILRVSTVDGADHNRIYDLTTAHYIDNTYYLQITLPNKTVLEKKFVTNSMTPDTYDYRVKRVDAHTGEFSFTSDNAGTVYYMAVADSRTRGAIGSAAPQNAQDVKRNGASQAISGGNNVVTLDGLTENVSYTIYFAVADPDGENLSGLLPSLSLPDAPDEIPDTGTITIQSAEQIKNHGFRVIFSKPTVQKLDISAFYAKCPAQAALHLGRVESDDNQTYDVYLKDGWFFLPKNHYEVKVTFSDGSVATGEFYAETYPAIGIITATRMDAETILVTFSSDKAGTIYYGTCPTYEDKPKDVDWVIANGKKEDLVAGNNELTLNGIAADQGHFYMVAVDHKGNAPAFVDGTKIPDAVTHPDEPDENANAIENIDVSQQSSAAGPVTSLNVTLKKAAVTVNLDRDDIVISGKDAANVSVFSIISSLDPSKIVRISLNRTLNPGEYKIAITLNTGKVEASFIVPDDAGLVASEDVVSESPET